LLLFSICHTVMYASDSEEVEVGVVSMDVSISMV